MKLKDVFIIILSSVLILAMIPAIIVPIIMTNINTVQYGWDITKLEERIEKKESFVAYFGKKGCSRCERMTAIVEDNSKLKEAFENLEKKDDVKNSLLWFYDERENLTDAERTKRNTEQNEFVAAWNKIITDAGFEIKTTTPVWLYFKKGELKMVENPDQIGKRSDSEIKDGDYVAYTFEGAINGLVFEGGRGKMPLYSLSLKEPKLIGGFEDELIGMKKDETKEFILQFPENYHNSGLAGRTAKWTIVIKNILSTEGTDFTEDEIVSANADILNSYKTKGEKWYG